MRTARFLPAWPLALAYLFLIGIGFYAVWIEPVGIRVNRFAIRSAKIKAPLRIAHVSDLHTHGLNRRERRLVELLRKENPDVILITGDSIIDSSSYTQVAEVLRELRAPRGVWVIRGNWENAMRVADRNLWGDAAREEKQFYESLGAKVLVNEASPLREDIWAVGLDEMSYGKPDLERATAKLPAGVYRIALFHAPLYFDRAAGHADLMLAGHCHGGQVRLPGLAPFYLPHGCGKYLAGWYEGGGSQMYVSRGIGNTMLDIRFNAPPELVIFDLAPAI